MGGGLPAACPLLPGRSPSGLGRGPCEGDAQLLTHSPQRGARRLHGSVCRLPGCLRPPAALALGRARASGRAMGLRSPPDVASAWREAQQAGARAAQPRPAAGLFRGAQRGRLSPAPRASTCHHSGQKCLGWKGLALSDGALWLPRRRPSPSAPASPPVLRAPPTPPLCTLCVTGLMVPGSEEASSLAELEQQRGASHACWGHLGSSACPYLGRPLSGPSCLKAGVPLVLWGPPRLLWESSPQDRVDAQCGAGWGQAAS